MSLNQTLRQWSRNWGNLALSTILACVVIVPSAQARMPIAEIGTNKITLEVAQTPQEIEHGLMGRTALAPDHGMVFLFHPHAAVRFWMAHCFISLDMLFIRDGKIVKIFTNVPPCKEQDTSKCPTYPSADEQSISVSEVIEVNAGYAKAHNVNEGDSVKFVFGSKSHHNGASAAPEPEPITKGHAPGK